MAEYNKADIIEIKLFRMYNMIYKILYLQKDEIHPKHLQHEYSRL